MLVFRLPEILLSLKDDRAKSEFLSQRQLWLETFVNRFQGNLDAAFVELVDEERASDFCLHEVRKRKTIVRETQNLDPVFEAYRDLRILHQINHANYKLQNDYKLFSAMPRRQGQVLSHLSLIAVVLLCIVDAGVLWQVFFPGSVWTVAATDWISVFTVCIALAALSVRAIEQGLQPEREAERYQQYRSAMRAILDRFDRAQSQAEKFPIMEEMEHLCFDELRNFLTTNERARFVL
jgi:hypothetical protein